MVQFIRGELRSGKTATVLSGVHACISKSEEVMLIVPSRIQRDYYTAVLAGEKGLAGKVVYTLNEAVEAVVQTLPEKICRLSDFESFILFKLIVEEKRKDFQYFKDVGQHSGVNRMLYSIITEMRAGNLLRESETGLANFQEKESGHSAKWHDLFLIYREYEKTLREKDFYDSYRLLLKAAEALASDSPFHHSALFVDGFYDFTACQFEFIKALVFDFKKRLKPVKITLLTAESAVIERTETDILSAFSPEVIRMEKTPSPVAACALSFLGKKESSNSANPDIKLIQAFGKFREIEKIAHEMKRLVLEESYRWEDMALVLRRPEDSMNIVRDIFQAHRIPYYSSKDEALRVNPAIVYLYSIVESVLKDEALDNVRIMAIIQSGYMTNRDLAPVAGLLDVFSSYSKCGKDGWLALCSRRVSTIQEARNRAFLGEEENGKTPEELEKKLHEAKALQESMKRFMELLFTLPESFSIDEFLVWIASLVEDLGMRKALTAVNSSQDDLAARDYNAFRKLKEAFISLKKALKLYGKDKFCRQEFFSLFDALIQDVNYRYSYYPAEAVHVLTPFDARETEFRAVFMAGLNEGEFPGGVSFSLLNHFEKKKLNRFARRTILNDDEKKNMSEKLDFAIAFSRANERVYLSSTPFDESGREILPSIFLLSILRKAGIDESVLKADLDSIFNIVPSETWMGLYDLNTLLANDFEKLDTGQQKSLKSKIKDTGWLDEADRMARYQENINLENGLQTGSPVLQPGSALSGLYFGRLDLDERVAQDQNVRDYLKQKADAMVFSSSRLECFGNCRYQFFWKYLMGIYEEGYPSQEIELSLKGRFYHAVLKDYVEQTKNEDSETLLANRDQYLTLMDALIEKHFELFSENEGEKALFTLEKGHYRRVLHQFAEFEARRLRDYQPDSFELEVKGGLDVGKGLKINITGSIDRVDSREDLSGKSFRILDYKSGNVGHYGTDMKIPLKLFQGFIYAKALDKAVHEISYISIEGSDKDKIKTVLPFKTKQRTVSQLSEIWEQKQLEIREMFRFIDKGDFSPFTKPDDYSPEVLEFYQTISEDGTVKKVESDGKCGFCPYQAACLRAEKPVPYHR